MLNERIKNVKGYIVHVLDYGKFEAVFAMRECPYCHWSVTQPTMHMCIVRGGRSDLEVTYVCPDCNSYYYFINDKTFQYVPEARLVHIKDYSRKPSRLDTIDTFNSLYLRGKSFEWFKNMNLDSPEIIEGCWTMAVEAAGQLYEKESSGKAPGYCLGEYLNSGIVEDLVATDVFQDALNTLREKDLL